MNPQDGYRIEDDQITLLSGDRPQFLSGVAAQWPAMQLWKGPSGLQRLIELAGNAQVQAMLVSSGQNSSFIGDMEHLKLLTTSFESFLNNSISENATDAPRTPQSLRLYLAQCPIQSRDPSTDELSPGPLFPLLQDVAIPPNIPLDKLSQVNFWASIAAPAQSSCHYDPYCGLLCVVQGRKKVRLVPPSAISQLSARPVYHESANHAKINLFQPQALENKAFNFIEFTLDPGDSVFIPAGWWHQVESTAGTLAVNFWWQSDVEVHFGGQNDWFYFRRLAQSLLETEKQRALGTACAAAAAEQETLISNEMRPEKKDFVIEKVASAIGSEDWDVVQSMLLASLRSGPTLFMDLLLSLRHKFPATTAKLLTNTTHYVIWEALTSGLERALESTDDEAEEALIAFYDELYSCVDDRNELTMVMLNAKEAYSKQIMHDVLTKGLGMC